MINPFCILLAGLLIYFPLVGNAQLYPKDWGQIEASVILQSEYPEFPGEKAIVLFERGILRVVKDSRGRISERIHHIRIKILTEEGLEKANVELPYFHKDQREKIVQISAQTINWEEGAAIVYPVSSKNIYRETISENWSAVKFSLPNARVGSVIEYKYMLESKSVFALPEWYFQTDIPTLQSDLKIYTPDEMGYTYFYTGHKGVELKKVRNSHWQMKNVPALREEPFMTTLRDYRQQVQFQLGEYVNQSRRVVKVLQSWEDFTKEMLVEERLGGRLKKEKKLASLALSLKKEGASDEETLTQIFRAVRDHMTYDGKRRIFADRKLSEVWEARSGSSAEINLILIFMLRAVGIEAHPLMISTRDHGKLSDIYPILNQFNQLICYAEIDGEYWTLNAQNRLCPVIFPEMEDLNGQGWLLDKENSRWIEVKQRGLHGEFIQVSATLDSTGTLSGNYTNRVSGYPALSNREKILNEDEETFINDQMSEFLVSGELRDLKIQNLSKPETQLSYSVDWQSSDFCVKNGSQIYLKPMLDLAVETNPFLSPERLFAVDFGYPQMRSYGFYLTIPEEYEVVEIPQPAIVKFPGGDATFTYEAKVSGNSISVETLYMIKRSRFSAAEYKSFKQLYDHMIGKYAEQIVLKRKQN